MERAFRRSASYPVSLRQYVRRHAGKHGRLFAEDRYEKATFVYDCLKYPENAFGRPELADWTDRELGRLKKPEDAFKVWWDV